MDRINSIIRLSPPGATDATAAKTWAAIPLALLLLIGSPGSAPDASTDLPGFEKFRRFEKIYEPSSVQQLPDGGLLILEDEEIQSLSVVTLDSRGNATARRLRYGALLDWLVGKPVLGKLEDLEGADVDNHGNVYAITSHSRARSGKLKGSRGKLIRFKVKGDRVVEPIVVRGLKKRIIEKHPFLAEIDGIFKPKKKNGFNIEGLSFDETKTKLLIGFRSPVIAGKAVIAVMENPSGAFERNEDPVISDQAIYLDLGQGGIRAMAFVPKLGGYLIISRREKKSSDSFKLWFWDGAIDHAPRRVRVADLKNFRNAEGISPVRIEGQERLMIVSDDGSMFKKKGGHYLLLAYEQLEIDPPKPVVLPLDGLRPGPIGLALTVGETPTGKR